MSKRFYIVAVMAFCTLVGASSCHRNNDQDNPNERPLKVEYFVVGEAGDSTQRTFMGQVVSSSEVPLSFPMGGRITQIYVRNGAKVKAGQVLMKVDDEQAKNMLDMAEAVLHQAEDGYERLKKVHDKGGVSDVRWVEMETDLQKARSSEQSARKRYNDCTMYAATSGTVNLKNIAVGEQLVPGQSVGSILSSNGGMRAKFDVPEDEIARLKEGQTLHVEIPALGRTVEARIAEKGVVSSSLAHTFDVYASLPMAECREVLQGMVCKVHLILTGSEGIVVPSCCVQAQEQGLSVWTVQGGKAVRKVIAVKEYVKGGVMVASGLEAGDTVVTAGYQKLYNGALVDTGAPASK